MPTAHWTLPAFAALAAVVCGGRADAQQPQRPPIVAFPQINTLPGVPAAQLNPPVFNPGPFYNPALNNPYLNQTNYIPVPVNNPLFAPNNPFVNNPFALAGPNDPFAPNPFLPAGGNTGCYCQGPYAPSTPPLAFRQPGQLFYRAPDLQVNPTSGLVYRPLSGVARTANGSTFYRVAGSGLPTYTGAYAPGTGLYYDPNNNT